MADEEAEAEAEARLNARSHESTEVAVFHFPLHLWAKAYCRQTRIFFFFFLIHSFSPAQTD